MAVKRKERTRRDEVSFLVGSLQVGSESMNFYSISSLDCIACAFSGS